MASTLGTITAEQRSSYNKVLISRAKPYTPGFKDAQPGRIPAREGTTIEWRAIGGATVATTGAGLALATTPLVEATPPSETAMTVAKVTKAVAQYGAYVKASDLLVHQAIDPIWAEIYALLGEQAGQTFHTLLMNDLAAGTNVQYASTATSRVTVTAAMVMTSAEIIEAVRTLERAKAMKFPDGFFHGIMHTDVAHDLRNDTDFKNSMVYNGGVMAAGTNSLVTNELRDWRGVRWMITTDAPVFAGAGAGGVNVFGTLVYGRNWFGAVDLESQPRGSISDDGVSGLRVMAVPVETETKDDPLGQFGVAGWKGSHGGKILAEWKGVRIESGATA